MQQRRPELIKLLIEYGAETNRIDINGDNVLHGILKLCKRHIKNYNTNIIQSITILLQNKVDVNKRNIYGVTPFDLARQQCGKQILSLVNTYT